MDRSQNGHMKHLDGGYSLFEIEDTDLWKLLDKPRSINIERNRSFDESSFSEMSISLSPPRHLFRNFENAASHVFDHIDSVYSPGRRSGIGSPRISRVETHPIVFEAWESLRHSLVYFRGQQVGTIAAVDHSVENLNYDQAKLTPI
ncbi:putative alkaline/neutral invertase B [Camellia lanceoleosa]|uniref:Alkaline/neutral invertase B n=1 Tax=Camellia lanceoleosa TaxID=1840588 RepID=A0ACC0HFQ0_9ERIC|nr:putative alkaline/neutral invertase B [Camellia lanceoleosa]